MTEEIERKYKILEDGFQLLEHFDLILTPEICVI